MSLIVSNLGEKLRRSATHWNPRIVGDVYDMHVRLVKMKGEFVGHHHDAGDELFLVVGRPRADGAADPLNTGNVVNERAVRTLERI
jgi:hypothetical protein